MALEVPAEDGRNFHGAAVLPQRVKLLHADLVQELLLILVGDERRGLAVLPTSCRPQPLSKPVDNEIGVSALPEVPDDLLTEGKRKEAKKTSSSPRFGKALAAGVLELLEGPFPALNGHQHLTIVLTHGRR